MRRVVSRSSAVSYCASTSQRPRIVGPASNSAVSTVKPTRARTSPASGPGSRSTAEEAAGQQMQQGASPPASATASRPPRRPPPPTPAPARRARAPARRPCGPAISSHCWYPARSAPASPPRSRSVSRCSNSAAPALHPHRPPLGPPLGRLRVGGTGGGPPRRPRGRAPLAFCRRAASHCSAQSGAPPRADRHRPSPSAQSSSSPSACLQGNFRLGQLHRYAGPVRRRRPSGTACCRCPCTAPTPPSPRRPCPTTARASRAARPPCVTRRQARAPEPDPPSTVPRSPCHER